MKQLHRRALRLHRRHRHGAAAKFEAVRLAGQRRRRLLSRSRGQKETALSSSLPQPSPSAAPQLQILGMGLMGSGKSTILRALARMLGGAWLNQDEFYHLGKNAKSAFLSAIRNGASAGAGGRSPCVVVDKINTISLHRKEILEALDGPLPRSRVLLCFAHPSDPPDKIGPACVSLCAQRIKERGAGHRSLFPDNPDIERILSRTAHGFQAPSAAELGQFEVVINICMTDSPAVSLQRVVDELLKHGCLGSGQLRILAGDALADITKAVVGPQSTPPPRPASAPVPPATKTEPGVLESAAPVAESLPIYWGVFFPPSEETDNFWQGLCGCAPPYFKRVPDKHVTLLYAGGAASDGQAAKKLGMPTADFAKLRESCERWEGKEVEVTVLSLLQDADVACASVVLPPGLPCANLHPHITLAHSSQVGPVHSNVVLARHHDRIRGEVVGGPAVVALLARDLGPQAVRLRGEVRAFRAPGHRPSRHQLPLAVRQRQLRLQQQQQQQKQKQR
mmetsp:Transcript_1656/g.4148  ORF Transcript_1656/g.4148 Transcript_1656/m.4148 type:complete len:507 (-) Transcript_1656:69-1589(-)